MIRVKTLSYLMLTPIATAMVCALPLFLTGMV